jgi:hypothetical protein
MEDLKKSLKSAGNALDIFSYGLSLASILASFDIEGLEDLLSYTPCEEEYPELYEDPDIVEMLKEDKSNFPPVGELNSKATQDVLNDIISKDTQYNEKTKNVFDEFEIRSE